MEIGSNLPQTVLTPTDQGVDGYSSLQRCQSVSTVGVATKSPLGPLVTVLYCRRQASCPFAISPRPCRPPAVLPHLIFRSQLSCKPPSPLPRGDEPPLTTVQSSPAPRAACLSCRNSCAVKLRQAQRLDGCLLNDRATAAFTQSPRSNYLGNGGHRPHSLALIEFQYLPQAALT